MATLIVDGKTITLTHDQETAVNRIADALSKRFSLEAHPALQCAGQLVAIYLKETKS